MSGEQKKRSTKRYRNLKLNRSRNYQRKRKYDDVSASVDSNVGPCHESEQPPAKIFDFSSFLGHTDNTVVCDKRTFSLQWKNIRENILLPTTEVGIQVDVAELYENGIEHEPENDSGFNDSLHCTPVPVVIGNAISETGVIKAKPTTTKEFFIRKMQDPAILSELYDSLEEEKRSDDFVKLVLSLAERKISARHVVIQSVLDRARAEYLDSIGAIRYTREMIDYYRIIYYLFGGACLKFLGGPGMHGMFLDQNVTRDACKVSEGKYNCIVPSLKTLFPNIESVKTSLEPGIIETSLDIVDRIIAESTKPKEFILSFDGKNITPGVSGRVSGAVDYWDKTDRESVHWKLHRLQTNQKSTNRLKTKVFDYNIGMCILNAKHVLSIVAYELRSLRLEMLRLERTRAQALKFHEQNPDNPKKYEYCLSAASANMASTQTAIDQGVAVSDMIVRLLAKSNGMSYLNVRTNETVDLSEQSNVLRLVPPEYCPADLDLQVHTVFLKQRTPEWSALRNRAFVTGSTGHRAIGLEGRKQHRQHYNEKVLGHNPPAVTPELQARFDYGTENESNAVATMSSVVLPALKCPCSKFVEVGPVFNHGTTVDEMILTSADGMVKCIAENCPHSAEGICHDGLVIEIKCPMPDKAVLFPHYRLPSRYVVQVLLEMNAHQVKTCWYVCYTQSVTTILNVTYDRDLCEKVYMLCDKLYGGRRPVFPSKTDPITNMLKKDIITFARRNSYLVAEVPSVKGKDNTYGICDSAFAILAAGAQEEVNYEGLSVMYSRAADRCNDFLDSAYSVLRKKSNELLLFMLSDSDRIYHPERPYTVPLAYALGGNQKALAAEQDLTEAIPVKKEDKVRYMINECRQELHKRDIKVLCEVYDGEHRNLCLKDVHGYPLSRGQLLKKTWRRVASNQWNKNFLLIKKFVGISIKERKRLTKMHKKLEGKVQFGNVLLNIVATERIVHHKAVEAQEDYVEFDHGRIVYHEPTPAQEAYDEIIPGRMLCIETTGCEIGDKSCYKKMIWVPPEKLPSYSYTDTMTQDETPAKNVVQGEYIGIREFERNLIDLMPVVERHQYMAEINSLDEKEFIVNAFSQQELVYHYTTDLAKILVKSSCTILEDIIRDLAIRTPAWRNKTRTDIFPIPIGNVHKLKKFTVDQLNDIADVIKEHTGRRIFRRAAKKSTKVAFIAKLFGAENWPDILRNHIPTLRQQCEKKLRERKQNLQSLRCVIARIFHEHEKADFQSRATVEMDTILPFEVDGDDSFHAYSFPEYNTLRKQLEPRTMDVSHMLTNLRAHATTKKGYKFCRKEAFFRVCELQPTVLCRSIGVDLIDKQNVNFACRVFSRDVAYAMRDNGDEEDADFVDMVCRWFQACEQRGFSADLRVFTLIQLHRFLTSLVDFEAFPPPGKSVYGIPWETYEAILQNISTRIQLYDYSVNATYSARSVGTTTNENMFSCLLNLNHDNLPNIKGIAIPSLLCRAVQLLEYQYRPNKPMFFKTSHKNVYPVKILQSEDTDELLDETDDDSTFRNHFFDYHNINRNHRYRCSEVTWGMGPLKGAKGLRDYQYKVDAQRMDPAKLANLLPIEY